MYPPHHDSQGYPDGGYPAAGIPHPSPRQPCAPPLPSYPSSPFPGRTGRPWSTGLCHCFDDPATCVITGFCPCITFGQIAEIVDKGEPSCGRSGTIYGMLMMTGFACMYSCCYRSKMRADYDLEEAPCADCLVHFCCEPCSLCQEYRELKNCGFDMGIGWKANMERQKRGVTLAPVMSPRMTR